jgi:predicted MPP superfamily phosphohydrolase
MRKFYLNTVSLVFLIFAISCTGVENQKVTHIVTSPGETAVIKIPDLNSSLKIMQITDSHISIADASEANLMQFGERMHKAYQNSHKHYRLDTTETTIEYLDDVLQKAKDENVELLLLTGDIVNFPSDVSVKYVYDRLIKTGIPWLYTSGNHDWHYEGMPGTNDSLRILWSDKSLLPLYNGHNPLYYSEIIHGINFVAIDNSTYEVNSDQIEFMKDQLIKKEPIILISHIPYNLDGSEDRPGMDDFVDLMSGNCDKIVAVFTGHYHRAIYFFKGNMCQYVSPATFRDSSFIVNINPVTETNP